MMAPQKPRSFKKKGKRQGQQQRQHQQQPQQQQPQRSMSSSDSLSALFDTSSNPTIGGEGETSSSSFRDFVDTSTLTGTVTTTTATTSPTVSASFTTTNTTSNNTTSTSSGVFTAGSPQSNNRHKNILNRTASNVLVVQPTLRRINHSIEDEYTIDKLRFDTLLSQRTLIGRQQEQQILYQALEAVQGNVLDEEETNVTGATCGNNMQDSSHSSSNSYNDRVGVLVDCIDKDVFADADAAAAAAFNESTTTTTKFISTSRNKQFILVSGESGVGKTALVKATLSSNKSNTTVTRTSDSSRRSSTNNTNGGLYVEGKFEQSLYLEKSTSGSMIDPSTATTTTTASNVGKTTTTTSTATPSSSSKRRRSSASIAIGAINASSLLTNHPNAAISSTTTATSTTHEPYAGIAQACEDICYQILFNKLGTVNNNAGRNKNPNNNIQDDPEHIRFQKLQQKLLTELGQEQELLTKWIPLLEELFTPTEEQDTVTHDETNNENEINNNNDDDVNNSNIFDNDTNENNEFTETPKAIGPARPRISDHSISTMATINAAIKQPTYNTSKQKKNSIKTINAMTAKHRFQNAIRRFIRVVAEIYHPFIIVLDDLHWSNIESMDIIENLLTDRQNIYGILIVGIYRSNEVTQDHWLLSSMAKIESKAIHKIGNVTSPHEDVMVDEKVHDTIHTQQQDDVYTNKSKGGKRDTSKAKRNAHRRPSQTTSVDTNTSSTVSSTNNHAVKSFEMQMIEIKPLSIDSVHEIIDHVLTSNDSSRTRPLAELTFQRTNANPLNIRHFLTMLKEQGLLTYNFGMFEWVWNIDAIKQRTQATENVVDLLKSKIVILPETSKRILRIASCLGTSFRPSVLKTVYQAFYHSHDPEDFDSDDFEKAILLLVESWYFEHGTDDALRFAHDKVQEAASTLLAEEDKQRIGKILFSVLSKEDLNTMLFVAVDILNQGDTPSTKKEFVDLILLNLEAARKAVSVSAFDATAYYAKEGIMLIDDEFWSSNCDDALDLYLIGCKAEAFLGHNRQVTKYFNDVSSRGDLKLEDKLEVYTVWMEHLAYGGQVKEAASLAVELLAKFRCRFPSNKIVTLLCIVRDAFLLKRQLKHGLLEKLHSVPIMDDPIKEKLVVIMYNFTIYLYLLQDDLLALLPLRLISWTNKFGAHAFTAVAVADAAVILGGVFEDFERGFELAKSAMSLRQETNVHAARMMTVFALSIHLQQPLRQDVKALYQGYEEGLRSGDTDNGGWCAFYFVLHRFLISTSLVCLVEDLSSFLDQMSEFNRINFQEYGILFLELFENLLKTGSDIDDIDNFDEVNLPEILGGYRISHDELTRWSKKGPMEKANYHFCQGFLYFVNGKYEDCANLAIEFGMDEFWKSNPGDAIAYFELLSKGVSCYEASAGYKRESYANRRRRRQYKSCARRIHRRVQQWIGKGNPNVVHYKVIFDAEAAAVAGLTHKAIEHYEKAIVFSARGGYLFEAALCSERLSLLYQRQVTGDVIRNTKYVKTKSTEIPITIAKNEASFRIKEAIKYYEEFGACQKVIQLQKVFSTMG